MALAAEHARANPQEDLVCFIVEELAVARGRRGRVWQHFAGHNLAITIIVRKSAKVQLPLVVSLAICEALEDLGLACDIKWPNDILVKGHKVCGVLVERHGHVDEGFSIVGVGLNVLRPANLPEDFPGAFLSEFKNDLTREQVLSAVLARLNEKLCALAGPKGWLPLKNDYINRCKSLGGEIAWQDGPHSIQGIAKGLRDDGALLVETADGEKVITGGDIIRQGAAVSSE